MTISTIHTKVEYDGAPPVTNFAVTYQFFEISDLLVTLRDKTTGADTPQLLFTDYTVLGGAGDTGTVVFNVAPTTNDLVIITRASPFRQDLDYTENDDFPAQSHERGLDKATLQNQEALAEQENAIRAPQTDSNINMELPNAAARGNKIVGFGPDGSSVQMYDTQTPVGSDISLNESASTGSSTLRTLADRGADVGNVKDFGAVGNGIADDTAAIFACLAAHDQVFFPAGTYIISSTLFIFDGRLFGEGSSNSIPILKGAPGFTGKLINGSGFELDHLGFERDTSAAMTTPFIEITGIGNVVIDCTFTNITNAADPSAHPVFLITQSNDCACSFNRLHFNGCSRAFYLLGAVACSFENIFIRYYDHGCFYMTSNSSGISLDSIYILQDDNSNADGADAPIMIDEASGISFEDVYLNGVRQDAYTGASLYGIHITDKATNVDIQGLTVNNAVVAGTYYAIVLVEGDVVKINGVTLNAECEHVVEFSGSAPRSAHVEGIVLEDNGEIKSSNVMDNTVSSGLSYTPNAINLIESSSFLVNQERGIGDLVDPPAGFFMYDLWQVASDPGIGVLPSVTLRTSTSEIPHAWVPASAEIELTNLGVAASGRYWALIHQIADAERFRGRSLTFSCYLKSSIDGMTLPGGRIGFGTPGVLIAGERVLKPLTTAWEEFSITYNVPIDATGVFAGFYLDVTDQDQQISTLGTIWMAGPQVSLGSDQRQYIPLAFEEELGNVQRMLEALSFTVGEMIATGTNTDTQTFEFMLHFNPKNIPTPILSHSTITDFALFSAAGTVDSMTFSEVTRSSARVKVGIAAPGLVALEADILLGNAATAQIKIDGRI